MRAWVLLLLLERRVIAKREGGGRGLGNHFMSALTASTTTASCSRPAPDKAPPLASRRVVSQRASRWGIYFRWTGGLGQDGRCFETRF
jgi:hypothetical protein